MSAPVTERPRGAVRTAARPAPAPPEIPARRGRTPQTQTGSARRAYTRRDERLRRLIGGVRPVRSSAPARRPRFVMLVTVLLGVGLVLTLGLSTAAAADSYRLQDARTAAGALTEQAESLRREVAVAGSATELARRATELGMVAVQDSARLVVAENGAVTVVGDPVVARAPTPVLPPVPAAPPVAAPPVAAPPVAAPPAADLPAEVPADAGGPAAALPADDLPPVVDPAAPVPADPAAVDPAELAAADPAAAAAAAAGPAGVTPAPN